MSNKKASGKTPLAFNCITACGQKNEFVQLQLSAIIY